MPFKSKYIVSVRLGYKRAEDRNFNEFKVSILVPIASPQGVSARLAEEKATQLMLNWPGRTGGPITQVKIYDSVVTKECY